uniref:Uncharacterized protein n=1 Tax=Zea mays TaxID=4577 RepID=B6UBW1_MAIZE|nr:hypothetical protein [Zea mays]
MAWYRALVQISSVFFIWGEGECRIGKEAVVYVWGRMNGALKACKENSYRFVHCIC